MAAVATVNETTAATVAATMTMMIGRVNATATTTTVEVASAVAETMKTGIGSAAAGMTMSLDESAIVGLVRTLRLNSTKTSTCAAIRMFAKL